MASLLDPARVGVWLKGLFQPQLFRQTPFRLTLVFLIVYAFVALLVFGYLYLATGAETRAWGNSSVDSRIQAMRTLDQTQGHAAAVAQILNDDAPEWVFVKSVFDDSGQVLAQNMRMRMESHDLTESVVTYALQHLDEKTASVPINVHSASPEGLKDCCRFQGRIVRLAEDFNLFVAMDMSWADHGFAQLTKALWGGALMVMVLGLFAGTLINTEVSRSVQRLAKVLGEAQEGNLKTRVPVRSSGDEFDDLALRINQTLERMEKTMGNLKYAGDAIAHDLRSPLNRLKAKLELSLREVGKRPEGAEDALAAALDETDTVLRTFQTVFAISRLQAAGQAPDQKPFGASEMAADLAELFEAAAEDKGIDFAAEIAPGVRAYGNADFLAQALSNLLDNAIKYTPAGGGVTFRLRMTSQKEVEFSVTDTGPGVPEADRGRIVERFVRLENSRSLPGVGLGLSMVSAVALAHHGRLVISEGPGVYDDQGPGLRTALVLPTFAG